MKRAAEVFPPPGGVEPYEHGLSSIESAPGPLLDVVIHCPQCGARAFLPSATVSHARAAGATSTSHGACQGCRAGLVVTVVATPPSPEELIRQAQAILARVHKEGGR